MPTQKLQMMINYRMEKGKDFFLELRKFREFTKFLDFSVFLLWLMLGTCSVISEIQEKVNETSSEILEDVLRQVDKLGPEKRKQILKKLIASNLISDSNDNVTKAPNKSQQIVKNPEEGESVQDEVEILDLNEPKMGTYKRKRSKLRRFCALFRVVSCLVF